VSAAALGVASGQHSRPEGRQAGQAGQGLLLLADAVDILAIPARATPAPRSRLFTFWRISAGGSGTRRTARLGLGMLSSF
jgi:hypothetical protein